MVRVIWTICFFFLPPWYGYNDYIESVVIEDGVTSIGLYGFQECPMKSITIPASVTSIGDFAFYKTGLTSIFIPKSVNSIGKYAFKPCLKLEAIHVSVENQASMSKEGVLFSHNETILYVCPGGKMGWYSIPFGVKTIE